MDRAAAWYLPRLRQLRWLTSGLCAASLGCASAGGLPSKLDLAQPVRAPAPGAVQPVAHVERLPPPAPFPAELARGKVLPITLDAVLRLAEENNPRIGVAREKLNESLIAQEQAGCPWLPQVYAGIAYYRHEGGIQDFSGRLLHSSTGALVPGLQLCSELDLRESTFRQISEERKVWQNKAELSQVNNEVLLEAATTYVDLLMTHWAQTVVGDLEKKERRLLSWLEDLAKEQAGLAAVIESIRGTLAHREHTISQLKQQGNAASDKLSYLLGLPPGTKLVPVDPGPVPIELVDASPATESLVNQALTSGPGVRELEGLLNVIQTGLDKSYGAHNLLPTVQVNLFEGALGAGPGGSLAWDNRLDLGVQLRWNLTQLSQSEYHRRLARSKLTQAQLTYQDLRNKLTAGVQEAKDAIARSREQIGLAAMQVKHSDKAYDLNDERMRREIRDPKPNDVLLSIRALEQARFDALKSVTAHNKAQVRLLLLLGGGSSTKEGPCAGAPSAPPLESPSHQ